MAFAITETAVRITPKSLSRFAEIRSRTALITRPCILQSMRILNPRLLLNSDSLKLSDEQKKQLTDLLSKHDEGAREKVEAQRKAAEEFVAALDKEHANQAALTALAERAMETELAVTIQRIHTVLAVRSLLTDEQNAALNELIKSTTSPWQDRPRPEAASGPQAAMSADRYAPSLLNFSAPRKK